MNANDVHSSKIAVLGKMKIKFHNIIITHTLDKLSSLQNHHHLQKLSPVFFRSSLKSSLVRQSFYWSFNVPFFMLDQNSELLGYHGSPDIRFIEF